MSEKDIAAMEQEIDAFIKTKVEQSEAMAKTDEYSHPLTMFDHLYAEIPPFLQEQRDELAAHLEKHKKKAGKQPTHV
jgi:TPP-dependent pyruvate/acetoin dehydrogenase alpha subunit